jgi:hypothetical protein
VFCSSEVDDPVETGKVVGVLFADSTEVGVFDDGAVIAQIVAACEEFGRYLGHVADGKFDEIISVESQATSHQDDHISAAEVLNQLKVLKPADVRPARVRVERINLEWRS